MAGRGEIAVEYQQIRHMEYTGILLDAELFDQDEAISSKIPCRVSFFSPE